MEPTYSCQPVLESTEVVGAEVTDRQSPHHHPTSVPSSSSLLSSGLRIFYLCKYSVMAHNLLTYFFFYIFSFFTIFTFLLSYLLFNFFT